MRLAAAPRIRRCGQSLIRLSDLDTNRRTRKVLTAGPSAEGEDRGKDPNPPKSDPFDSWKGRLPKRALMTDQTRRVPLPQSLKAKAAEAAAVLGTAALAKGAAKALPKVRKATGVVLRKDTRRVPVPESLRTRVLKRTADLRQRLAERRGQTALRVRRATGVTWREDVRRVPIPEKLRARVEDVKAKLAQSAASVPLNGRRVPATGVMGTLARRRVPLPEHLRVLREQAKSRMRARLTEPVHESAVPTAEGTAHREQARGDASASGPRAEKQAPAPTSLKPASPVSSQRVRRALGVAGQTALQTFAMGAGMSEQAEQRIRTAVSKTARVLQGSAKRVPSEMDKTSTPAKPSAQPGAESTSTRLTHEQSMRGDESRKESRAQPNMATSMVSPKPAVSRPAVKLAVKSEPTTTKAAGDGRTVNEPQPPTRGQERLTTPDVTKTETIGPSGINNMKGSVPSNAAQRPSVRRERPRIRPQEPPIEAPATPSLPAKPVVKRALTTKRTPPKS